jgi:hypothetical protein
VDAAQFQRELRRRLSDSSIEVRRDPEWAARRKIHPEALLVFEKGHATGRPYLVLACERDGLPVEPGDREINWIAGHAADRIHAGRRGWAAECEQRERERVCLEEAALSARFRAGREERLERAYHRFGWYKHWRLDRTCVSPSSSKASDTRSTTQPASTTATATSPTG